MRKSSNKEAPTWESKLALLKSDAISWLQSLRFSVLSLVVLAIMIVAGIVLAPSISIFVQQKKEINELRQSVELHQQAVEESEAIKLKWEDPVFIRAQARERLYYVMPGQTQLTVISDGVIIPADQPFEISSELTATERNWSHDFLKSVLQAGTTTGNADSFY